MISILVVDDDKNKIFSIIKAIHSFKISQVDIKQAICVQEAIELMQLDSFHLLISDLLMPLRHNDKAVEKGGENLIREIYKPANKINTPIYIVGLTQYIKVKHNFSGVWKVWEYDSSRMDWQIKLRQLLLHIDKVESKIVKEKIETIFVEGTSDKTILTIALRLFFEPFINKVSIQTIRTGAGAKWVERQLVIWGKTLYKRVGEFEYLKAIGLFDNDSSGREAILDVRKHISNDSAENKTISIIKLDRKYAKHLINSYVRGIDLPICLEEMYSSDCWNIALKKKWLEKRTKIDSFFRDSYPISNNSYLEDTELSEIDRLYINYKFNDDHKAKIVTLIQGMNVDEQKKALYAFEPLLKEVLIKLKLLSE